ncbi:hypothetical protein M9Y10_022093 [Tritrichomonas musculus]|uniref:Uncharacterized protein n=1 Tax=Tritrichomonas musculus TaxID=1915356 RepID=A0ABR2KRL0_9EUKA
MYLQQAQSTKTFEEMKELTKLDLVLDDITVASKQLSILNKRLEDLTKEKKDAEFLCDELTIERENLLSSQVQPLSQTNTLDTKDDFSDEGQFFGYLNSIENREVEISAKIEANKQIQSKLRHDLSTYQQQNMKLKSELEPLIDTYNDEEAKYRNSDDIKKDLLISLDQKTIENENILQKCEELKEELDARNEELNGVTLQTFTELKKKLKTRKEELANIRNKSESLRSKCESMERTQRKELLNTKDKLQKGASVTKWRTDRSVLKNKLKMLKTQLYNEQKNIEQTAKRDKDLDDKFKKLLDEDPNHNFGQCEKARKCVLALINDSKSRTKKVAFTTDLDYENEYTEQLLKEKEKIKKSKQIFNEYKDNVLSGLNIELDGCSQNGYIKLLRDEFYQLQNELSKLV